jgi:hypothetical protein
MSHVLLEFVWLFRFILLYFSAPVCYNCDFCIVLSVVFVLLYARLRSIVALCYCNLLCILCWAQGCLTVAQLLVLRD